MKMLLLIIALIFSLAALVPACADPEPEMTMQDGRAEVKLAWQNQQLLPGQQAMLGVIFDIEPLWHIQAGKGSGDDLPPYIPTSIKVTVADGWETGKIKWPTAHIFTIGEGEYMETLAGYEGEVLAAVQIDVPSDAQPGEYPVMVKIEYQACDDKSCEMPLEFEIEGKAVVVAERVDAASEASKTIAALFKETLGEEVSSTDASAEAVAKEDDTRLKIDLALYEVQLVPGQEATLGVIFDISENWHIQAGKDSGDEVGGGIIPTEIKLVLPEGWVEGKIKWPAAHTFVIGEGEFAVDGSGYQDKSLAAIPITLPQDIEPGEYSIKATVNYQACDDKNCERLTSVTTIGKFTVIARDAASTIPRLEAKTARLFTNTLSQGENNKSAAEKDDSKKIDISKNKWWLVFTLVLCAMLWMVGRTFVITTKIPARLITLLFAVGMTWVTFIFVSSITRDSDFKWTYYTHEDFNTARANNKVVFIKFTADWCPNCLVNESIILSEKNETLAELKRPDVVSLKVDNTKLDDVKRQAKDAVGENESIPLMAIYHPGEERPIVIRGLIGPSGQIVTDALRGKRHIAAEGAQTFNVLGYQFDVGENATILIMFLAFIAGILMNFTPCVLPVVPLKILSLQAHAKDPRKCFFLGLVFGLGIVTVFAVLAVLLAGLITGIEKMNWGDWFQFWWLNAIFALVIGVMGAGMLGLFAMRLPQFLYMFNPQGDSTSGSFLMGVFAALLATPCTGPLLAGALVWAATQPAAVAFTAILLMGVGMAFPYVLLTAKPAWLDRLPRTGPGSELIKQVMGLLLIAVSVYFVGNAIVGFGVSA